MSHRRDKSGINLKPRICMASRLPSILDEMMKGDGGDVTHPAEEFAGRRLDGVEKTCCSRIIRPFL